MAVEEATYEPLVKAVTAAGLQVQPTRIVPPRLSDGEHTRFFFRLPSSFVPCSYPYSFSRPACPQASVTDEPEGRCRCVLMWAIVCVRICGSVGGYGSGSAYFSLGRDLLAWVAPHRARHWATRRVEYGMFKRVDGTWLPPEGIREVACRELDATPSDGGGAHVFYCQSAVRTTQLIFGMCRAGWPLETLKNYDGSWVEWSHVATDDEVHVVGRGEE